MRNLSISKKLYFLTGLFAIILIIVRFSGIYNLHLSNHSISAMYKDRLVPLEKLSEVNELMKENLQQILLGTLHDPRTQAGREHSRQHSIEFHSEKIQKNNDAIQSLWNEFLSGSLHEDDRKLATEYWNYRTEINSKGIEQAQKLMKDRRYDDLSLFVTSSILPLFASAKEKEKLLYKSLVSRSKEDFIQNQNNYKNTFLFSTLLVIVGICIGSFLAIRAVKMIVGPIKNLAIATQEISKGNRNIEIPKYDSKDEVGALYSDFVVMVDKLQENQRLSDEVKASQIKYKKINDYERTETEKIVQNLEKISQGELNVSIVTSAGDSDTQDIQKIFQAINHSIQKIVFSFRSALREIQTGSDQILQSSKQLSDASQGLASGSSQQASSLEQISAAISEIENQARLNTSKSEEAMQQSRRVKDAASHSGTEMEKMLVAMEEINNASGSIARIVKEIDAIAFQTNILALNAAVEAARAGVYGRGFNVVAEEVRNLASRSANAAQETTKLIEETQKKITSGVKIAEITSESLNNMVSGVAQIVKWVEEIAIASKNQTESIAQLNIGLNQINEVTMSTASSAEQTASASEELASQAESFQNITRRFVIDTTTPKIRLD